MQKASELKSSDVLAATDIQTIEIHSRQRYCLDTIKVIIWLKMSDLGCGGCKEALFIVCKLLESENSKSSSAIIVLFEKENRSPIVMERFSKRWKEIHSISFTSYVVEGSSKIGIKNSCILINTSSDRFVKKAFPFEKRDVTSIRELLLKTLSKS
ncbi:MAG: hypothetical protein V1799_14535 [bacterium]